MCLKLLPMIKVKHSKDYRSAPPLTEEKRISYFAEGGGEVDEMLQVIKRLKEENQELESVNEMLRKQLADNESRLVELESTPSAISNLVPIISTETSNDGSDKEKRLVNRMLDILTMLDVYSLDSNACLEVLVDSLRGLISNTLSEYGISLYRDESVAFNPKWHHLIAWEDTDDLRLNNLIKKALSTGVRLDENCCLRPEKVSVYKSK